MTNEEIAAFAFAVHVRNVVLECPNDLDEGDGFPVEEWRERYAEALKWSQRYEALYPSPGERVHQIQRHLIEQRP